MKSKKEIAAKLAKLRGERSREETAAALSVSLATYTAYEEGERIPADEIKERIADLYGVSVYSLFFGEERPARKRDVIALAHKLQKQKRNNQIIERYDMALSDVKVLRDLQLSGADPYDVLCIAFNFGFIMGHRATKKGYKESRGAAK